MNKPDLQQTDFTLLVWIVTLCSLTPCLSAGELLQDKQRGFKLTLPDGFKPIGDLRKAGPSFVHGYARTSSIQPAMNMILLIEDLGREVEDDVQDIDQLPAKERNRAFMTEWNGLDLIAVEESAVAQGTDRIGYSTVVPLKGNAIRFGIVGSKDNKQQVKRLFQETLSSLEGETSWSRTPQWLSFVLPFYGSGSCLLALGPILAIAGGVFFLWLISSRAHSKLTMLGLCAFIWFAGRHTGVDNPPAKMLIISGCLQMIGSIGFLMCLLGLFKKPKPRPQRNTQATS